MRSRVVKPGFFLNEELTTIPAYGRLLFLGLWMIADREGRFEWRPKKMKAELFPYESGVKIEPLLEILLGKKFIRRYSANGLDVGDIPNFTKHQSIHKHEARSVLPPYDMSLHVDTSTDITRNDQTLTPSVLGRGRGRSRSTEGGLGETESPEELNGHLLHFGLWVRMTHDEHQELCRVFGDAIVAQELPEMDVWIGDEENPKATKHRTPGKNHYRFARTTWLPDKKLRSSNGRPKSNQERSLEVLRGDQG